MARTVKTKDKDKGYKALVVRAKDMARSMPVRVGIHPDAGSEHYPDGTSVLDVAIWNEFGTENIPERSFLRAWFEKNQPRALAMLKRINQLVLEGKLTREQGLNQLGLRWVAEIQERMSKGIPPPNAPSTIAKKGSSTPLIDDGILRSSIKHTIGDGRR